MFIFWSDDREDPGERSRRYKIEIIVYALEKHKKRNKAAEYLNINKRTLTNLIAGFPELSKYRIKPTPSNSPQAHFKRWAVYDKKSQ